MKLRSKTIVFITIALLLGFVLLAGYPILNKDQRETIAMAVLYDKAAEVTTPAFVYRPDNVFSAALNERFPAGSEFQRLVDFVSRLHGECERTADATLYTCKVLEQGTLCAVKNMQIKARVGHGLIKNIEVFRGADYC